MDIRIVPLDLSHDRAAFSCGNADVDRFLREDAIGRGARFLAGTHVAAPADHPTVVYGYYTLLYQEYRDKELRRSVSDRLGVTGLRHIPVILVAQLGVHSDRHGQGLGTLLMRDALDRCLRIAGETSCVAIVTDPADDAASRYYTERFKFRDIGDTATTGQQRLYLPIRTIALAYDASRNS